jgi:aminoglycoside 6'-N-acetyltransferase
MILRPLSHGDEAELLRIHATPEVARWWGEPEPGFPWSDDPDSTRLAIELDGALVGMVQFCEELTPRYRHAAIDLSSTLPCMAAASVARPSRASLRCCSTSAVIIA